jgi:hypothetical protein
MHFDPEPEFLAKNSLGSGLMAKVEIARIEEIVYVEIYAIQARAKSEDETRIFATNIMSKLQGWLAGLGIIIDEIERLPESSPSNLQFAIRYLAVQLLLLWPHEQHPDVMYQEVHNVAKTCMQFLLRLWHFPLDQRNHSIFPMSVLTVYWTLSPLSPK